MGKVSHNYYMFWFLNIIKAEFKEKRNEKKWKEIKKLNLLKFSYSITPFLQE